MPISATGTSTRARRAVAGFTLIELTVVIFIISLVAAIVIPRLPSTGAAELRTAARTLAATLRYLQDRAITGKTAYRMHIELGTGAQSVRKILSDGTEAETGDTLLDKRLLPEGVVVADLVTQRAGKRSEGEAVLTFGMSGIEDYAVFHLKGAGGAFYTVTAYPASGKVTVDEGYREESA